MAMPRAHDDAMEDEASVIAQDAVQRSEDVSRPGGDGCPSLQRRVRNRPPFFHHSLHPLRGIPSSPLVRAGRIRTGKSHSWLGVFPGIDHG